MLAPPRRDVCDRRWRLEDSMRMIVYVSFPVEAFQYLSEGRVGRSQDEENS
jgi:hypothetical protein